MDHPRATANARKGVLLGLATYACFSFADAVIKSLGPEAGVFAISFWISVFIVPFVILARPDGGRWKGFHRAADPVAVHARAFTSAATGLFGIHAFTTVPLAEAYALIFLAPAFIMAASAVFLRERPSTAQAATVIIGFAGVMIAVRPGFRELEAGHLSAVAAACMVAATVVLSRRLAGRERHVTVLGWTMIHAVLINGAAVIAVSEPVPAVHVMAWLAGAAALLACAQVMLLSALRNAPASAVGATQYTQIAWAVVIGAAVFGERPDLAAMAGLAVTLLSGTSGLLAGVVRGRGFGVFAARG